MHSKTLFVSAVLALSFVSAAPVPVEKRCAFGNCVTNNDNSRKTDNNSNTSTNTTNSDTTNTSDSGNQSTAGNNGGGQDNSGNGGFSISCRRSLIEGSLVNHQQHARRVKGPHHANPKNKGPAQNNNPWSNSNSNSTNNVSNNSNTNTNTNTTANSGNTANSNNTADSHNTSTNIDNSKNNNANLSGNTGNSQGNGLMCRREFIELEMQRRELDTGASVLAAMGGLTARDVDDKIELLATRDLGRMAELLGVRAMGHDGDDDSFTHYKRDVGTECMTEECAMMKREVDEMLREHARSLGYWVEDDME